MADVFNIAGRIHSTSQEEVVTTTNEILDDTNFVGGKKQSEVNQEVSEELALHTNRLNALTGQNYVTVVATQSTTAADIPTLINASGEGEQADTLYRVGFWDGSAYVADKYTEYAWNGTAYVILDVKSSIGEVFDISQYNAVGGTPATYADLTAAISGANVPTTVQDGGMSIKFIDSTTNKYVQYRLMATSWSTTVTDWQSMNADDEPTAESNNLVKSGGVAAVYGSYVENPEFVYVKTDNQDRILWAIKTDGTIFFGAGVPPQIVEYVQSKIDEYHGDDIVAFLGDFLGNDQTLREYLDDIYGKYIENPEWIKVLTDAKGRIIAGVRKDGSVFINKIEGLDETIQAAIEEFITENFTNKSTTDKFSEDDGKLMWDGSPIASETSISTLVVDLPVSDGTGIESGYAYIDSTDRTIKVKA